MSSTENKSGKIYQAIPAIMGEIDAMKHLPLVSFFPLVDVCVLSFLYFPDGNLTLPYFYLFEQWENAMKILAKYKDKELK